MPGRSDLDPLDIPSILPHVYLVDVGHEPLDFSYRLLGTEIVKRSRRDYTGRRIADLPDQKSPSQIWSLYRKAVVDSAPVTAMIPYVQVPGRFVEVLAAPLSADGREVDMIFGAVDFPDDSGHPETGTIF